MEFVIKRANKHDIDELSQLYDELNDCLEAGINNPGWKKGVYPVRKNAEDGIEKGDLYVTRHQEKIVGSVILSHKPEGAYNLVAWESELDYSEVFVVRTLVVHPEYSGLGIGKKLLDFSAQLAIEENIKAIRLDVYEENEPAIKLYEKCGFRYIDTVDLGLGEYGLDWFRLYEKVITG